MRDVIYEHSEEQRIEQEDDENSVNRSLSPNQAPEQDLDFLSELTLYASLPFNLILKDLPLMEKLKMNEIVEPQNMRDHDQLPVAITFLLLEERLNKI